MPLSSKRTPRLAVAHLRATYRLAGLSEADLNPDPIAQFEKWFEQAREAKLKEPNAMTLATATSDGKPSARIVLLKEVDENGFVFYTNYESRKGRELVENPRASLVFYWEELERQVRVEGAVERVSREQSEAYFRTRPKGSRLGAWASHQSKVLESREIIENRLAELARRYESREDIPLPDYWGGFRIKPEIIEFWQGRPNRLHDRLCYRRKHGGDWTISRLSP